MKYRKKPVVGVADELYPTECDLYVCDKCGAKQIPYIDWFPISISLHWCRSCVAKSLDEIPDSEKERASEWLEQGWRKHKR